VLLENCVFVLGLTVFADESGTHDEHGLQRGSEVTVIAGYIADKRCWERVTQRWNTALRKYGVNVFHMSSYWRNESPYDKWSDAKKKKFLRSLIRIARDGTWFAIGGMVPTKDYDELMAPGLRSPSDARRLQFSHPYHFCFAMLLVRFMAYLTSDIDQRFPRKPEFKEKVAFVFDQQQQFEKVANLGFALCKKLFDQDDRFLSITFASKTANVPLQAADLLAFYSRRILTHQLEGKGWKDPFERMMEERNNLMLHYFTRQQMEDFAQKLDALEKARAES
jgi:hypothetical protein